MQHVIFCSISYAMSLRLSNLDLCDLLLMDSRNLLYLFFCSSSDSSDPAGADIITLLVLGFRAGLVTDWLIPRKPEEVELCP
jgi:hypothetical protein